MKEEFNISYRQSSGKIYAIDINKYQKGEYKKLISLRIYPGVEDSEQLPPSLVQLSVEIKDKLNEGNLVIHRLK